MRKNTLLLVFFTFSKICFSQVYQLTQDTKLQFFEESTTSRLSTMMSNDSTIKDSQDLKSGYLFKIKAEIGDNYLLEILPFNDVQKDKIFYNTSTTIENQNLLSANKFYLINKKTFKSITAQSEPRFNFGTVFLPVKIRFEGGKDQDKHYTNFEGNVNLGLSLTFRLLKNVNKNNIYAITSFSTSQIKINAETTNNFIPIDKGEQTNMALTPGLGLLVQFESGLQFTIMTGIDYLSGKVGREWVYRDQPFLGVGFGFNIIELGKRPTTNKL